MKKSGWAFLKYQGDLAIYAICQNCGFGYPCYKHKRGENGEWLVTCEPDLERVYKFCPECGRRMSLFNGDKVYKYEDIN